MTAAPRKRGPAPRFSRDQLIDAALAIVETEGFGALSLRSVARHLGAGPMTLYTYVDSSEELAALVIDRLIEEVSKGRRWPRTWRGALQTFAKMLDDLVSSHPAMVDAYGRGIVRSPAARRVANEMLERLATGGLSAAKARDAYIGVHAIVLGYAVIRPRVDNAGQDHLLHLVDTFLDGL